MYMQKCSKYIRKRALDVSAKEPQTFSQKSSRYIRKRALNIPQQKFFGGGISTPHTPFEAPLYHQVRSKIYFGFVPQWASWGRYQLVSDGQVRHLLDSRKISVRSTKEPYNEHLISKRSPMTKIWFRIEAEQQTGKKQFVSAKEPYDKHLISISNLGLAWNRTKTFYTCKRSLWRAFDFEPRLRNKQNNDKSYPRKGPRWCIDV